ncbi:MAG: DUF547 domain-containing protein, partial [Gammaproteobacteria bacterium]|nr:DUF547 domain-containing protein [Gammaproteobacteria bacterium]
MIRCFAVLLLLAQALDVQAAGFDHSGWDGLLKRHIVSIHDGQATRVDYAGISADRAGLNAYLATTSAVSRATFDGWPLEEQLSFLINAYNAW